MEWQYIAEILQHSLKKHGDQTITVSHLLNIIKMVNRRLEEDERLEDCGLGPDDYFKQG